MPNRPSSASIACYVPGADGIWRPRYPTGNYTGATLATSISAVVNTTTTLGAGAGLAAQITAPVTGQGILANTVPGQPLSVSAVAGNAKVTVSFSVPYSNGGVAISGYTVNVSSGQNGTGLSSPITVAGLTNGTPVTATVSASNALGTGNPSAPSGSVTPVAATANYDGTIKRVSGSPQLVNSSGIMIQLRGANFSGLETCGVQSNPPWYGSPPNWSYYQTWKPNCARIPLAAPSFLGLSCRTTNGTAWSGALTTADPGGAYIAAVDAAIRNAQAIGCYVILDLHWSAPKFTFGGDTEYCMPLWQPPFMNMDTDLDFWKAIANRYGTQATPQSGINNNGIIFDLFNEPYLDQINGNSNASSTWNLMKNGGTQSSFSTNSATSAIAQTWTVLGYQTVLNAIRTIGANNVLMMGGCGYANACSGYATFMATDTLSPPQTAVSIHLYQSGSTGYPQTYPDSQTGTSSWSVPLKAAMSANIPVVCGESGGNYGPSAANPDTYVSYVTSQADTLGFSLTEWEFWAPVSTSSGGQNNLSTTSQTPTNGQGSTTYNWLTGHTAASTVPDPPTIGTAAAGNAQATISFTANGNGGSPITGYTATSSSGKTGTGTSSPISVTGLTNNVAVTFTVTATNSIGTSQSSAASNSVTPVVPSGGGSAPTLVQMLLQGQTSQNQASDAGGNNRFQPQNPNYTMIGWLSVSGATTYNVYRATIPVGSQSNNPTYSLLANVTASAAASAYSGYVSGSGGAPYQTAVNCAYGDSSANGCVNGTRGGGSASAPGAGDLWAATGYTYKVSAVVGGLEGTLSAPHYAVYIENGLQVMELASFNNQPSVLNSTAAGTDPLGNSKSIVWTSGPSPYWNPYCGNGATEWNMNLRAFNYVEMYVKAAQNDGSSLTNAFENEGDAYINNGTGVNFSTYSTPSGNLQSGVWTLVKMPLSVLFTDSVRGRQNAFYKCIPSVNGMSGTWYIGTWRFVT